MKGIQNSKEQLRWWEQAKKVIPSGCSTLAKSPTRLYPGITPICCKEAKDSHFIDLDGNEWLDCDMAMGSIVWGHSRQEIELAIIKQLRRGVSFSVPAKLELEVAETILGRFGHFNCIRFCKNGADAVSAAVRVARRMKGKQIVIYGAYHGWHDWSAFGYYERKWKQLGIPRNTRNTSQWLDVESFENAQTWINHLSNNLACIIVTPENWLKEELKKLKELCYTRNICLIFDEVSSSIRFGKRGVAGAHDVWPDMMCISKGLANGLPLAAVLARDDYSRYFEDVKFTNTYSSECLALAAAKASEYLLKEVTVWPTWRGKTEKMMHEISNHIHATGLSEILTVSGYHGSFRVHTPGKSPYEDSFREYLVKFLAMSGVFSKGFLLFSAKHTDEQLEFVKDRIIASIVSWGQKCLSNYEG